MHPHDSESRRRPGGLARAWLSSLLGMSSEAATAAGRFFEALDEPASTEATPLAQPAETRTRAAELAFESVEFRYPDARPGSPPVLHDVNLRIAPRRPECSFDSLVGLFDCEMLTVNN